MWRKVDMFSENWSEMCNTFMRKWLVPDRGGVVFPVYAGWSVTPRGANDEVAWLYWEGLSILKLCNVDLYSWMMVNYSSAQYVVLGLFCTNSHQILLSAITNHLALILFSSVQILSFCWFFRDLYTNQLLNSIQCYNKKKFFQG